MKSSKHILTVSLLVVAVGAQDNFLSSLLSEAQSIYTVVTSALAPQTSSSATTTSRTSTSTSSSSSATSASSTSSSTSSSNASSTSSPSTTLAPTSVPAATQSSANNAAVGNNTVSGSGGSNTLAIVLGCTLGALALAAFLALLYFCLRRRKHSRASAKHRPLSPDEDEIESWKHEKPRILSNKGPMTHTTHVGNTHGNAQLTSEYGHQPYLQHHHQNPFVPPPPPARRSSRNGLCNTEYSAHPYSPDHVQAHDPHSLESRHYGNGGNGSNHALAAGVGGAALGGIAAHAVDRHERKRSPSRGRVMVDAKSERPFSEDEYGALPQATGTDRRSGSVSRASAKEPWPFMDARERRSTDTARTGRPSMSRSQDHFTTPDPQSSNTHTMLSAATLAGATAAASRKTVSRSPHRKGILKQNKSDSSDPSSMSDESTAFPGGYVTNLTTQHSGPHELAGADYPPTPKTRARRNSPLGTGVPPAAAAAHYNRRRSTSSSRSPPTTVALADRRVSPDRGNGRPNVPSRSPKRTSLDHRARYSSAYEGTAELPVNSPKQELVSPPLETQLTREQDGLISPISPIGGSQYSSWSKAQAEQLGMNPAGLTAKASSSENTAVDSQHLDKDSSEGSDQQSSGLVSAIQRIFNSQKSAWAHDDNTTAQPERAHLDRRSNDYYDQKHPLMSVPNRNSAADGPLLGSDSHGQYSEVDRTSTERMPGAFTHAATSTPLQQQHFSRHSDDSGRSLPPQYRSRGNSLGKTEATDFATVPATTMNTTRPRAASRPGYGIGSGDPFDLARVRTDSNMTGVSLSNYVEPAGSRPQNRRSLSGEHNYKEPTLAEVKREIQEEDRERLRKSQEWRRSRGNSAGLRYGDDKDLFALVDQTTGAGEIDRFYGKSNQTKRSSGTAVGRAY